MSAPVVIEARGLRKVYRTQTAVDGIGFTVHEGEICGLLGPNGSGKTTTILMLLGLTEPTDGSVSVLGLDPLRAPLAVKRRVGYMPDSVGFYDHLTARENLRYTARIAGLPRDRVESAIADALAGVRLTEAADRKVGGFSRGMRQRLGLAEIVMKGVEVAILDEPTSGLDPQATHEFLDLIRDLRRHNVAVLLSSHLLDQVQSVCDRVFLFHAGRIALQGSVEALARQVLKGGHVLFVEAEGVDAMAALSGLPGVREVAPDGPHRYRIVADENASAAVAARLVSSGARLHRLNVVEPSLDDIYTRYFDSIRRAA